MQKCPFCDVAIPAGEPGCPRCGSKLPTAVVVQTGTRPGAHRAPVAVVVISVVIVMLLCSGVIVGLLVPAILHVRESTRNSQCERNLKAIGLALHNYHDAWGTFPPAYTEDANGRRLHSWRVLILPYLGQTALYNSLDLTQPWDSPENARFQGAMPREFGCPSDTGRGSVWTNYVVVVGDRCVFRGATPVKINEITDGLSNTIFVGEVAGANIPWMKPEDVPVERFAAGATGGGLSSKHTLRVHFLMGDGTVQSLPNNPAKPAMSKFTRDGSDW